MLPTGDGLLALLGATLIAAVLANLLNNVPAVLLLLPAAAAGGTATVLAVLIGVNAGPNLTPTGSLATLLWRRVLRDREAEPSLVEFLKLGAVTVPPALVLGTVGAVAGPAGDRMTRVLVWVTPTGWEACIDAARAYEDVTLLQVSDVGPPDPGGLLGRHRPPPRAGRGRRRAARRRARAARPRRPTRSRLPGKPEHAVVDAADDFDLLILSRTNLRPGPHSIGHAARFVVDHARCPILLVWPGEPGTGGPPHP